MEWSRRTRPRAVPVRMAHLLLLLALTLAAATVPAAAMVPGATVSPLTKVEGQVLDQLDAKGSTTFFVFLKETADLRVASTLSTKVARTTAVYQQLTATADRTQAGLRKLLRARGATFTPYWIANTIEVVGDRALVEEIAARPEVARVEAERFYPVPKPQAGTDEPGINVIEWNVSNIRAPEVWSTFGTTGEGIVVANIDTGVQFTHPAVVDQYRGNNGGSFDHDFNFFDPANVCPGTAPCDNNAHGTHTMGTMVGDDGGSNQIGVAPGAEWIAAKGCESNSCSSGSLLASGQWVVAPTDSNGNNPRPDLAPDVVNNSWGGGGGDSWYMQTVNAWINAGIFPSFSNGNSGPGCGTAGSPADYPQSYGVGAYDINNNIAGFSSRGPSAFGGIKPNIAAPGVNVRSSVPNNSYSSFSGTSMAAPHLSAAVALIWSAEPSLRGNINATRQILDDTARDENSLGCGGTVDDNNNFGEGRLDVFAAVQEATGGGGGGDVVFEDDFETNNGWVTDPDGSDDATTGLWERGNPDGTSFGGTTLQLGTTTSGTNDLVTGADHVSTGSNDIDNGVTSAQSPAIQLPSSGNITLTFNWYFAHLSNSSNADFFHVFVVSGGQTNVLDVHGSASNRDGSWTGATVNLSSFAGQSIRILVEASDNPGPSLSEAGVDDVRVTVS